MVENIAIRTVISGLLWGALGACTTQPASTDVEMIVVDNFGPFTVQRANDFCAARRQIAETQPLNDTRSLTGAPPGE